MSGDPHWLEYVRALGPVVVALAVAYIAYQQWQTNRLALKEKLLDRRLKIIDAATNYFEATLELDTNGYLEKRRGFSKHLIEAEYLFSSEIHKELKQFFHLNSQLRRLIERDRHANRCSDEQAKRVADEKAEIDKEIEDSLQRIWLASAKYMRIDEGHSR